MNDPKFQSRLFFFNGILPLLLMIWDWGQGKLGANPVEFLTRCTGVLALVFVVITLLVTPLRKLTGWNWMARHRRQFGVFAAFYGLIHLATYLGFDRDLQLLTVPADVWKRPFIAVGMLTFVLMVPLAVTSTNGMIKRLGGKRWTQLHRLTYLIAIGGVVHYWMIVKSDITWPAIFGVLVAILLGYRIYAAAKKAPARRTVAVEER